MSSTSIIPKASSLFPIQIENLSFTYRGTVHPALKNINLTIRPGEFLLIAGPSGCGKTTLARSITGFIPQEFPGKFEGNVSIYGMDTQTRNIHELAGIVNLIQQDPDSQIVTLNVIDEIAFGPENFLIPPEEIRSRIDRALQSMDAELLKHRTTLTLSGGEKQKIAIASFLAVQAPIILLDEPTTRLDPPTAQAIIKTLALLHQKTNATILVIDHRLAQFFPVATRCVLMESGQIIFDGTPNQLIQNPIILEQLGVHLSPVPLPHTFTPSTGPTVIQSELVRAENLSFQYPTTEVNSKPRMVLKDISFSVQPGEIVGLVGANGSGKTTLLLNLIGLLQPTLGEVYIAGQNIRHQPVSDLARQVGFIFQNPLHQIFERSVWEEVLLASSHLHIPSQEEATARAERLLEKNNLASYKSQSPFMLSTGEQRRLTIASVLIHHPQLLLLDEPFIGQDYENVKQLMVLLLEASNQKAAVILASHDLNVIQAYCHRLLFLQEGQLLLDGPVSTVFNQLAELEKSAYLPSPLSDVNSLRKEVLS